MSFDIFRLVRLAFAGAMAGFFIFLIFNPAMAREEAVGHEFFFEGNMAAQIMSAMVSAFVHMLVLSGAFSVMLGGMLVLADEYNSAPKRVALRMGIVSASGAFAGAIAGVIAQFLYIVINLLTLGYKRVRM